MKILEHLEQIRKSAEIGKNFSNSQYDVTRYKEILVNIEALYKLMAGVDITQIDPVDKVGYITPKVGVNGILERKDGAVLLEKRVDDQCWAIPGGWCEVGMSPEENVIKELFEETGYTVAIDRFVGIMSRNPSRKYPFTSYHILYQCSIQSGELQKSYESEDVRWIHPDEDVPWHEDHKNWIDFYLNTTH